MRLPNVMPTESEVVTIGNIYRRRRWLEDDDQIITIMRNDEFCTIGRLNPWDHGVFVTAPHYNNWTVGLFSMAIIVIILAMLAAFTDNIPRWKQTQCIIASCEQKYQDLLLGSRSLQILLQYTGNSTVRTMIAVQHQDICKNLLNTSVKCYIKMHQGWPISNIELDAPKNLIDWLIKYWILSLPVAIIEIFVIWVILGFVIAHFMMGRHYINAINANTPF